MNSSHEIAVSQVKSETWETPQPKVERMTPATTQTSIERVIRMITPLEADGLGYAFVQAHQLRT